MVKSRTTWFGAAALLASASALVVSLTVAFTRPQANADDRRKQATEREKAVPERAARNSERRRSPLSILDAVPRDEAAETDAVTGDQADGGLDEQLARSLAEEAWISARRDVLDSTIRDESRDSWSGETELEVRRAMSKGDFGEVTLEDVRCGTTVCRLSAQLHGNLEDTRRAFELGTTRIDPVRGRVFMHFDGGFAAERVTTYFMRKGYAMPLPNANSTEK